MDPARWDELETLFGQALALPPEQRPAFLDEACAGDDALRAELASLLAHYEEAPAYFDDLGDAVPMPALPAPENPPGPHNNAQETLLGATVSHYAILEELGAGGMGVVFRAEDTRLDRIAALKFLPSHLQTDEQAAARFIQEAKAASALDHPNICTIYDIGETDEGQIFIAMAHYDGQTLKQKIKRGPLPLDEALDTAMQIARGLAKAHTKDIVHRDVKPANVIITDDGVVKILDFGLAKMADVQMTKTGTRMGTVAYMSPEQARGDKVDHRTDVWSLGVVLYEMFTGERPFPGNYDQAIIYSLLNEEPTPLTQINPELPEEVEHLVTMCLEKERDLRYPSIADLLADLEVLAQNSGTMTLSDTHAKWPLADRQRRTGRRKALVAGASLAALLVLLFVLPPTRQALLTALGATSGTNTQHIAVLPFTHTLGDDPEHQALADGLTYTLTSLIARLERVEVPLWVVPANEVLGRGVETASDARKIFGVNRVVAGNVFQIGDIIEVNLELIDPEGITQLLDTDTIKDPLNPAAQDAILAALADLLRVKPDAEAQQALRVDGPAKPTAYAFYVQGMGYLQRYDQPGNLDYAIMLFDQALEEDSLYALAHAGLCETYLEQFRATNDSQWIDEALRRCTRAVALDDQLARVHIAQGKIYFYYKGQYEKAETALRHALALEGNDPDAYDWLGRVYERQGRFEQARDAYQQAIALKPEYWLYHQNLGITYFLADSLEQAGLQFEEQIRLTPDNYLGYNNLGVQRRNTNREAEAKALFLRSIAIQPTYLAHNNLGQLHFRDQEYTEAARMFEQARDLRENVMTVWKWLGYAYYWAEGERERAQPAWQRLIELATPRYEVNPRDHVVLNHLAEAHILLGDHETGQSYLDRLRVHMRPDDRSLMFFIARMYEILGDRNLALQYLEDALDKGFDPVIPHRDPWFEALRKTPQYEILRLRYLEASKKQPA